MTGLPPTNSPRRGENSPASPPAGSHGEASHGGLPTKAGIAAQDVAWHALTKPYFQYQNSLKSDKTGANEVQTLYMIT